MTIRVNKERPTSFRCQKVKERDCSKMETKCGRRSSRMKNGTVSVVAKINSNVSKKKNKKL